MPACPDSDDRSAKPDGNSAGPPRDRPGRQPLKVLYVNSLYAPDIGGGAEVALSAMVRGFLQRGQEASILTTHGGDGTLHEWVDGVPVHRISQRNIYAHFPPKARPAWARMTWHALDSFNLAMRRQAARVIDEVHPDLIVCHNLAGLSVAIWGLARQRKLPLVQVLHDYYTLCPRVTMFRRGACCTHPCRGCSLFRLPHRRASNAVSAVVGVSQAVLDIHLRQGLFAQADVRAVVHNAHAMPLAKGRPARDRFTFGYIGSLTEIKGVERLTQAFLRLATDRSLNLRLLIAGTGKDELVQQLKRSYASDRISFVGHVNPSEFFAQIDVCVVPSLWNEPLGLVVFEAIASGAPVIGARRGGIAEIIRHEVNGLLFEPDEAGALEQAMLRLMRDPSLLESMRAAGRASVARFLDPQRMLDEYEVIYRRVLQRPVDVGRTDSTGLCAAHGTSQGANDPAASRAEP